MGSVYRVLPRPEHEDDADTPHSDGGLLLVLALGVVASASAVLAGLLGDAPWRTEHTGALLFTILLGAGLREPVRRWLASRARRRAR